DAQRRDGEGALLEDAQHLRPHEAGGADHPDPHRQPRSSPKAPCRARTAGSTSLAATTHEIRIDDVEIISMLIPSRARTSNISAATPGWVFMPAPTSETRPISASWVTPAASRSSTIVSMTFRARVRSSRGTVNEMSVWPALETFCTIMSTFTDSS